MKKLFALLMCLCMMLCITACGAKTETTTSETTIETTTEVTVEPTKLTYKGDKKARNYVDTEEGVTLECSSNYVFGPAVDGFYFGLSEEEYEKPMKERDEKVTIESPNAKIYKVELFDYDGNVITTVPCDGKAEVDRHFNDKYIHTCVVYLSYEGKEYLAHLARTGK